MNIIRMFKNMVVQHRPVFIDNERGPTMNYLMCWSTYQSNIPTHAHLYNTSQLYIFATHQYQIALCRK